MNPCIAILMTLLWAPANLVPMVVGGERTGPTLNRWASVMPDAASDRFGWQDAVRSQQHRPDDTSTSPPKHQRIVVVVSSKNPIKTLTPAELARIFLRQQTQWPNGWAITVFVRPMKAPIRQRFSQIVLHKKPEALHEYWLNLKLTRGLKPPKVLRSAMLVKRYLERVKGGIAYLYEDEVDETVRVVTIQEK
ncbi:MAG: hypothetical protein ACE5E5_08530 [Phycisphaerae bacterium]